MPLLDELRARAFAEPMNLAATVIFLLAIVHTFLAARFSRLAHDVQHRHDAAADAAGRPRTPGVLAECLHFLGEVEVVFGLWVVPLMVVFALREGWDAFVHYLDEDVVYTEPLFVIVIMALASTRPIVTFAEACLRRLAAIGRATPAAWWLTILTVAPLLGSFITEPGAMTIAALLLARQFYDLQPSPALKYGTLGLLFVNVSIGGTLTHFAAPPVLMVANRWNWDMAFMLSHFGWRAVLAVLVSTACYYAFFRTELTALAARTPVTDVEQPDEEAGAASSLLPIPAWVTAAHLLFMAWTVWNAHHSPLFLGGFLFFLGFLRTTAAYQSRLDLRAPLLVGFFLAGLVIHGTLQDWWITPVLASLGETSSFIGAAILTSFNDNALITYLATLVPNLSEEVKLAVVEGAVTGGGLTVIANAPNPAGQALLARFFDGAVHPLRLFLAAVVPTLIAAAAFRLI
jgi:hypothetical protein